MRALGDLRNVEGRQRGNTRLPPGLCREHFDKLLLAQPPWFNSAFLRRHPMSTENDRVNTNDEPLMLRSLPRGLDPLQVRNIT